ncbi:MAG: tetratricopeptide repeat protein [Candidatus Glassbacteria bacterium]
MHPDRPAEAACAGCGEYFCSTCLDPTGNCPACSNAAERFLEGFRTALSRWEATLKDPSLGIVQEAKKKKRWSLPRALMLVLILLAAGYTVFFWSHYHVMLGEMFIEQGNLPKAEFHLEKALAANPDDSDLHYELGNVYYQQGKLDQSIEVFNRCIQLDSTNAPAMNNLAWVYAQLSIRLEEALTLSRKSLELEPDNPNYLDTAAEIYYQKKEYFRALTFMRRAVEQQPPNLEYYQNRLEKIKKLAYSQSRHIEV